MNKSIEERTRLNLDDHSGEKKPSGRVVSSQGVTDGAWGQSPGQRSLPTSQINTSLVVSAVWPQHRPPGPTPSLHDGQRFPPARPPADRPPNLLVGHKHGSEWLRGCSPSYQRLSSFSFLFFFSFCFPRSRPVPPLRLARESWLAPLGQRGQPDSCGPTGPLPPLWVQRGGTIDALPLASRLTFVPLTCQRKQGLVCCPELVEFSRKKKGNYEREKFHSVLVHAI